MKLIRQIPLVIVIIAMAVSCKVQLVIPYDEVIDVGLKEYKEEINTFLLNMASLSGTEEGKYENNQEHYNQLEAKINVLIERSDIQSSGACKLIDKTTEKVRKELKAAGISYSEVSGNKDGDTYGCTKLLLENIKIQLALLEEIHQEKSCPSPDGIGQITCIQENASKSALDIINQAIRAAWIVETAKKTLNKL